MAFDTALVNRLRSHFNGRQDIEEKRMFGGMAFMIGGHMCVGVLNDSLVARIGPDQHKDSLSSMYASPFDYTGKPLNGFVYVAPEGIRSDTELADWVTKCEGFVFSLPPKH